MEIWIVRDMCGNVLAFGLPSELDLSEFGKEGVDFWVQVN